MRHVRSIILVLTILLALASAAVLAGSWKWPAHVTFHDPVAERGFACSINRGRLEYATSTGKAAIQRGKPIASMGWGAGRLTLSFGRQMTLTGPMTLAMNLSSVWPVWLFLAAACLYPLWRFIRGPLKRRLFGLPGHCRKCGYDLKGNTTGVCSECGTAIEAKIDA